MSASCLGKLIKSIWGGKVAFLKKISAYRNLRLKVQKRDRKVIKEMNEDTVKDIHSLCQERGWFLDLSQTDKNIVSMQNLSRDTTGDGVVVNGKQLEFMIRINLETQPSQSITIRSHGHEVPLREITGKQESECSIRAIEEAMYLCEFASPCIGQKISNDKCSPYKIPVCGSTVISVISEECGEHTRMVSNSCLLLNPLGNLCPSCQYIMVLFNNRDLKWKASDSICTPSKMCNIRYLNRIGLEKKIAYQRKELRNDVKKEARINDLGMLEFMEEDNWDLEKIFEGINPDDVPPNMKLVWEMQKKQLLAKSSRGHRWDPRYHL